MREQRGAGPLGYQTNIWGTLVLVAVETGAFDDAGVAVEDTQVDSGNRVRDLMVAGQADVGTYAGPTLITGALEGDIVATTMVAGVARTAALVVRDGAGIEEPADLVGKRIAIQAGTSTGRVLVNTILPEFGIGEGDFEEVNLSISDMIAAMAQGAIDAMQNVEPYNAIAEAQGLGTRLLDFDDYDPMPMFMAMRGGFIDERHDDAVNMLRGLETTARSFTADPEEAIQVMLDFYSGAGFEVDEQIVRDAVGRLDVQTDYIDGLEEYMEEVAAGMLEEGQIDEIPDFSQVLRTDIREEALAELD